MNTPNTLLDAPALDSAQALYQGEGLALPPVPEQLAGRLRQVAATAYASRDMDWTLYDFAYFLDELQSGQAVEPYVAFGLAGHGLTSQAVHYYSVADHCAVLYQMRWGTPADRPEPDRARHNAALAIAQKLQAACDEMARTGKLPAGRRLVVADSSFHGGRWGWLPTGAGAAPASEPTWRLSRNGALVNALTALMRLD